MIASATGVAALALSAETTRISGEVDTLITPAPFTFGIWGVLLGIELFRIIFPRAFRCEGRDSRGKRTYGWDPTKPRRSLRTATILIGAWPYFFVLHPILTTFFPSVVILALALYFAARAKSLGPYARSAGPLSPLISWLTTATILNISVWLKGDYGWADSEVAAAFVLALIPIVAALGSYLSRDWLLALGLTWPLIGIIVSKQSVAAIVYLASIPVVTLLFWGRGSKYLLIPKNLSAAQKAQRVRVSAGLPPKPDATL